MIEYSYHTNSDPERRLLPHELYDTRHEVSSIPYEVFWKIWCEQSKSKVRQNKVIYLLLEKCWDGSVGFLACQSRRPLHHPNEHTEATEAKIKLVRRYHKRNPKLKLSELWHRLKKQDYSRRIEILHRIVKKFSMLPTKKTVKKRAVKPYEQMKFTEDRIQIDIKIVPRKCLANLK